MKEVVVISGKGGTGKTSITSSFAVLEGKKAVIGDCDVDADDMHLLLSPDYAEKEDFYSGLLAKIDADKCVRCGKCKKVCKFNGIRFNNGDYEIDELNCEGCGYCEKICPNGAISMKDAMVGNVFISTIKTGASMVHARLSPGADNSGKLVAKVKKEASIIANKNNLDLILIDGSPGVGCPVVSSLTGANYVILVTEPSISGVHDIKRVYQLVKQFKIKAGLIINKSDINKTYRNELKSFAQQEDIKIIAELPYNEEFTRAMTMGLTVVEYDNLEITKYLQNAWQMAKTDIYKD